jgi:hypothetical protein
LQPRLHSIAQDCIPFRQARINCNQRVHQTKDCWTVRREVVPDNNPALFTSIFCIHFSSSAWRLPVAWVAIWRMFLSAKWRKWGPSSPDRPLLALTRRRCLCLTEQGPQWRLHCWDRIARTAALSAKSIKNCHGKTFRSTQAEDIGGRRQCSSPIFPSEEGYTTRLCAEVRSSDR